MVACAAGGCRASLSVLHACQRSATGPAQVLAASWAPGPAPCPPIVPLNTLLPPPADDEEDQPSGGGGAPGGDQGQMLYIPGLGYIPLANFPGLQGRGGGGPAGGAAPPPPEADREWSALAEFPEATQDGLLNALGALREDGRAELTLLVLGKGGVGKSSTVNSLLNERVAAVTAFQQDMAKPTEVREQGVWCGGVG